MICTTCNLDKDRSEFYSRSNGKLRSRKCKLCVLEVENARSKEVYAALKAEVMRHYGGENPACKCCGESEPLFLTIDHIHGGGSEHRRQSGQNIYRWYKRQGFPEGYQILCWNCNSTKGVHGECPHETQRRLNGSSNIKL